MEEHYKLFHEENHTINYKQITDIEVKKNIWDRMCGVGDLIIHTGNDESIDNEKAMIIKDIKQPETIKNKLLKEYLSNLNLSYLAYIFINLFFLYYLWQKLLQGLLLKLQENL